MKVGFDLDGTLDRPAVASLARLLVEQGHEVHIISGCFTEAGEWQDHLTKYAKLARLGLITATYGPDGRVWGTAIPTNVRVCILDAVSHERFDRDYRLIDLGLRKGAYIAEHGIEIMFDDSELYCKTMPSMCGAQIVHVR